MKAAFIPGSTFAGYRIESLVGRGGMGVVYKAIDPKLGRPVALKLIAPDLAETEEFRARFLREPQLAASLDHPNVIPIYDAGEAEGQLYLAMRFVDGRDLKSLLESEGTLAAERALQLLAPIADALDAAHRRGLVHRDVKPANVLVDSDGHPYLTDFGITKQSGGASTDTGRAVGTLDYLAPEQIRGEPVDGRTDCYALACVFYECIAGVPPFHRETEAETLWAHMQEEPPSVPDEPWLDPVLRKAFAKEKQHRHPSCVEFLAAGASALGIEPPVRRARRLRIGRRLVVAGALLLVAAAGLAVALELGEGGSEPAEAFLVAPDSVAVLDPGSNRITGQVRIPGGPSLLAADGRTVWVASDADRTVSAIDTRSLSVRRVIPSDAAVFDMAAGDGSVWLLDARTAALLRVDPAYGAVTETFPLRAGRTQPGVDTGRDAVWATDGSTRLLRLDPRDGRIVRRIDLGRPLDDVAVGAGAVWVVTGPSRRVLEVDPRSGAVRGSIPISGRSGLTGPVPVNVVTGEGAVWVLNADSPSVTKIDPRISAVEDTIPLGVGSNPSAIAVGGGAVWVALSGDGALARLDPTTGSVQMIDVGGAPIGVAVARGRVWISVQPGFRTEQPRVARAVHVPGQIDEPFCTPVEFGGEGAPRFLIASDFPLQLPRVNLQPLQFTDAVRFVLARHRFRAGKYSVGYQSCDDSSVQIDEAADSPWTPGTCRRSGRTYSQSTSVIGVIGPFASDCASFLIPILGRARDGPLAVISGSATAVGLTRGGPGARPGEPERYYPSGTRNFARVVAADHVQGAAAVLMARRLEIKRLFVLDDGQPYGIGLATTVRRKADEVGLAVAGSGRWRVPARHYRRLARRISRSGADGVFLGGYAFLNGGRLLRDLRGVLGREVELLAPDGFSDFPLVVDEAGAAAEGLVVSHATPPVNRLPAVGRRFVAAFEKAIGRPADPYSIMTAQATGVLLAAIAASDGTRGSVTEHLLRVRVKNGLLGSFRFDANGDTTATTMTMYRIEEGKARVQTVIRPPANLVR